MAASLRVASSMNSAGTPLAISRSGWLSRHELAVLGLDLGVAGVGRQAQRVVGIGSCR